MSAPDNRNPNVKGNPDNRMPLPLSAEGETVDANPPMDEPVGPMPNGPYYKDDDDPEADDVSAHAKDEE
jgi:hypothetical protein